MNSNKTINLIASVSTENIACEDTAEFHGVSELNGKSKIIVDKRKMWGTGAHYDCVDGVVPDISSVNPSNRTPSYQESEQDERIQCQCVKTGKRFLFVGSLEENIPGTATPKQSVKAVAPNTVEIKSVAYIVTDPVEAIGEAHQVAIVENSVGEMSNPKIPSRRQRDQEAYLQMVQAIAAQRAAGLDPDVCMAFITVFVNESRATLYRKMGKTFPLPRKRGRSNFWPLSEIEAYKATSYPYLKGITSPKLLLVKTEVIVNSASDAV